MECVQKQLNILGYEIGTVTGVINDATLSAGKEYVADMKRQDPNWGMAMIANDTALLWCEKVAEAHWEAREFWDAYQRPVADPAVNMTADQLFNRGYRLDAGDGVAADSVEAAKYYRMAADKGSAAAMRNLAGMYGSGRGVTKNDAEARRLFRAAAAKGDAQAQYALGKWYSDGADDSIGWFRQAAAQSHAEAIAELKKMGLPLERDAGKEPETAQTQATQTPATPADPTQASWWVGRSPTGQCITVGNPISTSPDLGGEHKPQIMIVNTFGKDPNLVVVERSGGVKSAQTYINIDGTMFPVAPIESGYQFLMLSRGTDAKGKMIWNTPELTRLAHLTIMQSMKSGKWLAVQTVVREGKDTGKTFVDLYSLAGFTEAKAASDAQCKNGPSKQ